MGSLEEAHSRDRNSTLRRTSQTQSDRRAASRARI